MQSQSEKPHWTPEDETFFKVLEERAKRLTLEEDQGEQISGSLNTPGVAFILAGERMALDTRAVAEVVREPEVCPLPGVPGHVLGVMNLHGSVVAVMDFARYWGMGETTDFRAALVLCDKDMELALVVEEVGEILDLARELESPPPMPEALERVAKGMTAEGLLVLDAGRILSDSGLIVREE